MTCPQQLNDILKYDKEHYFLSSPDNREITDPMTGEPFIFYYNETLNNNDWRLISPGFDKKVDSRIKDNVIIQYDPTNGLKSSGDIIFTSRIRAMNAYSPTSSDYNNDKWLLTPIGYKRKQP